MRYVAAYMLAAMSGKHHITTADIENILGSVGVDCDHDKASNVVDCMHGKTVDELIAQGSQYLCAFGGAGLLPYSFFWKDDFQAGAERWAENERITDYLALSPSSS
ncbi:unnamed protein product [Toxocara canis]|uniref:Large ribosomal subunit protein P2 n=1 Tax=Toxocara canis TaxID=6265 RepID=A0A183U8Y0_TOXCA|nr:unnamed protein product [Toxocara canis]VDM33270.1 unnamed protein product [Toxocara canis]